MEIRRAGRCRFHQMRGQNGWRNGRPTRGIVRFREAELARSQFCRIDGTKTRQRSGYPPTRSRGRKHGGLSVRLLWGRAITQNSWLQGVEPADVIRPGERCIEGFNDLHATAAAGARWWLLVGGAWDVVISVVTMHRRARAHRASFGKARASRPDARWQGGRSCECDESHSAAHGGGSAE